MSREVAESFCNAGPSVEAVADRGGLPRACRVRLLERRVERRTDSYRGDRTVGNGGADAVALDCRRDERPVSRRAAAGTRDLTSSTLTRGERATTSSRTSRSPSLRMDAASTDGVTFAPETKRWMGITFWDVDEVYAHPCSWDRPRIQPGPTAADSRGGADDALRSATPRCRSASRWTDIPAWSWSGRFPTKLTFPPVTRIGGGVLRKLDRGTRLLEHRPVPARARGRPAVDPEMSTRSASCWMPCTCRAQPRRTWRCSSVMDSLRFET